MLISEKYKNARGEGRGGNKCPPVSNDQKDPSVIKYIEFYIAIYMGGSKK